MLNLKLQYFGHMMQRTYSFEETLMLGKTECVRRRWQKMRWLDGITNWMGIEASTKKYFYFLRIITPILSEKTLMLRKIEGRRRGDDRRWDGWMASLTWWTWVWVTSGSWWWTGSCSPWTLCVCKELDTTEWLNGTEPNWKFCRVDSVMADGVSLRQ